MILPQDAEAKKVKRIQQFSIRIVKCNTPIIRLERDSNIEDCIGSFSCSLFDCNNDSQFTASHQRYIQHF